MRDYLLFAAGFIIGLMLPFKIQCIIYAVVFIIIIVIYQKDKVQSAGLVLLSLLSIAFFFFFGNLIGNTTSYIYKTFNYTFVPEKFTQKHIYILNQPQLELTCSLNGEKHFLTNYNIEHNNIISEKGLVFNKNNCDIKKGE